jgi:hypothetical protein
LKLVFLILLAILLHGCERKVRVKLKVRSADAGQVQAKRAASAASGGGSEGLPERVPQVQAKRAASAASGGGSEGLPERVPQVQAKRAASTSTSAP